MREYTNGDALICIKSCFCEHYIHELINYPREDLKELKLEINDVVEYVGEYLNFYGVYLKVKYNGDILYILPSNLASQEEIDNKSYL